MTPRPYTWPDGGCGNDCDGPEGHREGCPVHCHCFDGEDRLAEAKDLRAALVGTGALVDADDIAVFDWLLARVERERAAEATKTGRG